MSTGSALRERPALFIAGDERIYFPALVAFTSIELHNPGMFDKFICCDIAKLGADQLAELKRVGVAPIDASALDQSMIGAEFVAMHEGTWPVEIFLNWLLPDYLHAQGYRYSVKCDYDMLCVDAYALGDILPGEGQILAALKLKPDFALNGPSAAARDALAEQGLFEPTNSYINVGFVVFDNQAWFDDGMTRRYAELYALTGKLDPETKYLEQAALGILFSKTPDRMKGIAKAYNQRIPHLFAVSDTLEYALKNIHYNTSSKPWRPLDLTRLAGHAARGRQSIYLYRNIWLHYAATLPGFEQYCSERPLSELDMLALSIRVLGERPTATGKRR